ncbi:hypothetical protein [Chromobacterium amazonense]|uniref:N-acetyltransferase domain-containing protein n=1 Tax=Chromobacterium amazonense TaxID=1382803 RepID=A0ABU8V559_9NEIS|nr:hypothetical protein [Chromobacterium amazonense]MDQ4540678.1 hypothetical protein [Chromobacterium amazonense]
MQFFNGEGISQEVLEMELKRPDVYVWVGMLDHNKLIAIHRGLVWGGYLLLKGVAVSKKWQGSIAALQLASFMLSHAKLFGLKGVAAWVEPSKPERFLSERLKIKPHGQFLHRYSIPFHNLNCSPSYTEKIILSGRESFTFDKSPLVDDIFMSSGTDISWIFDNGRLVLSANPCGHVSQLSNVINKFSPLAKDIGAKALEVFIPAVDLMSSVEILRYQVQRLSRTPVRLGIRTFEN